VKLRHLPVLGAALFAGAVVAAPAQDRPEASADQRRASSNNLKQIALALHNYHDVHLHFPPAAICDKDGKPLLSWRVAILPFIEQNALYKQFKLDEPWDSDHNKKLAAVNVKTFTLPGIKAEPGLTFYRALVGNGAAWDLTKGIRIVEFADGTSNTILVVEAKDGVPWTKPDELTYDPNKLPEVGYFKDGFTAVFADGATRWIKKSIDAKVLHALITRAGGEVVAEP
jgi:hypothetical protein